MTSVNGMLRLCKYYQYSIHSKYWLLVEDTSTTQGNKTTVMLICCLKQLKYFIIKFSICGISFSFFNYCFFSFRWMCWWGCRTKFHGHKYDFYFLQCHTLTTIHFMNHGRFCQIFRTIFNIYICLNHCWWCEHNQS